MSRQKRLTNLELRVRLALLERKLRALAEIRRQQPELLAKNWKKPGKARWR
jgi:hypothetical protein